MKKAMTTMLILSCFSFVSCQKPTNTDDYVIICNKDGQALFEVVCDDKANEQTINIVESFINKLQEKCNTSFVLKQSSSLDCENEIVVGSVDERENSLYYSFSSSPTSYNLSYENNDVVVFASMDEALKTSLEVLYDSIEKLNDGSYGIKKDLKIQGDINMKTVVPRMMSTIATYEGYYYCENNNYQLGYSNASELDFKAYNNFLVEEGFEKAYENDKNNNKFSTLVKGDAFVSISYYPEVKRLHVLYGPKTELPSQQKVDSTKVVEPSITHIGRQGASQSSPGLSIVCQLKDGSYVIVDGGPNDENDEKALLEFLKSNNPKEGKPQVTWMFTHAHHDHMGLAVSFLSKYYNEIDVKMFYYNFPDFDTLSIPSEYPSRIEDSKELIAEFDEIIKSHYSNSQKYIFHTGDKLQLPGCEIEILLTHEGFWPNEISWINHTSSSWIMNFEGKTMMVLGDTEATLCQWLAASYKEKLKSDILQVTHHGLNGGDTKMYSYVDPSICLWPIDQTRFESEPMCLGTKYGFEFNAWIRDDSIRKRTHYAASSTTTLYIKDL